MKNVKLVALVVLVVALAVGGVIVGRPHEKTIDKNDYYYYSYEIKYGDTYWSIAEEYKMPDDDIREWINEVKKSQWCKFRLFKKRWPFNHFSKK